MHALRAIHRVLIPGGILLDIHPIPPSARAEVRGESLGEFDDAEFFEIVRAAEALLEKGDLFSRGTDVEFDWLERYESGEDLLDDVKTWEGCRVPRNVAARVRRVCGPVDVWERVVLRRFRAN
ncbi:MAG: hypothetical protein H0V11_05285 [Actinobacteria bacterium]|nr:hypothetical protein [Actinomycetota bacterium]